MEFDVTNGLPEGAAGDASVSSMALMVELEEFNSASGSCRTAQRQTTAQWKGGSLISRKVHGIAS